MDPRAPSADQPTPPRDEQPTDPPDSHSAGQTTEEHDLPTRSAPDTVALLLEEMRRERQQHEHASYLQLTQFERMLRTLEARTPTTALPQPKISMLRPTDDIEAYLVTFERLMTSYSAPRSSWTLQLAPQLTGKAQQAYAALDSTAAADYDLLKAAILHRYAINTETYRSRFRTATLTDGETNVELVTRLTDLARKWTASATSIEAVLDLLVLEQLTNTLPRDVQLHVRERQPRTARDAATMADAFVTARKQPSSLPPSSSSSQPRSTCSFCGKPGHTQSDCFAFARARSRNSPPQSRTDTHSRPLTMNNAPVVAPSSHVPTPRTHSQMNTVSSPSRPTNQTSSLVGQRPNAKRPLASITCFRCGSKGHYQSSCTAFFCAAHAPSSHDHDLPPRPRLRPPLTSSRFYRSGLVDGQSVDDICLDTGCSQTLVHSSLVQPADFLPDAKIDISCAHGDVTSYPLADIEIILDGQPLEVRAAVSSTLPHSVLLGTDVPHLFALLADDPQPDVALVATRAQLRRQEQDEKLCFDRLRRENAHPTTLDQLNAEDDEYEPPDDDVSPDDEPLSEPPDPDAERFPDADQPPDDEHFPPDDVFPFDTSLFEGGRERPRFTHRERRKNARTATGQCDVLDLSPAELQTMQRADPTIGPLSRSSPNEEPKNATGYFVHDDPRFYQAISDGSTSDDLLPANEPRFYRCFPDGSTDAELLPATEPVMSPRCCPSVFQLADELSSSALAVTQPSTHSSSHLPFSTDRRLTYTETPCRLVTHVEVVPHQFSRAPD